VLLLSGKSGSFLMEIIDPDIIYTSITVNENPGWSNIFKKAEVLEQVKSV